MSRMKVPEGMLLQYVLGIIVFSVLCESLQFHQWQNDINKNYYGYKYNIRKVNKDTENVKNCGEILSSFF